MSTGQNAIEVTDFIGEDVPALLRQIATFLEEPGRVLIGMWSTGFAEPWEVDLQVVWQFDEGCT